VWLKNQAGAVSVPVLFLEGVLFVVFHKDSECIACLNREYGLHLSHMFKALLCSSDFLAVSISEGQNNCLQVSL